MICKFHFFCYKYSKALDSGSMLKKMLAALVVCLLPYFAQSVRIIWDNDASFESIGFVDMSRASEEVRMPNWFLIFPEGTKWCGAGNIAANEDDLGEFSDTDKCCRSHDLCDDVIDGYQTKYNLTNPSFYSRLTCKCDKQFYKCLKSVNSKVSTQIGHLYFTGLNTKCFKIEHPIVKCKKYSYIPTRKCIQYEFDESKEPIYQWFDVPNF